MFGEIVFVEGQYSERVLCGTPRIVVGMSGAQVVLFRVEWTDPEGYSMHKVCYSLYDVFAFVEQKKGDLC